MRFHLSSREREINRRLEKNTYEELHKLDFQISG
jgi:hypothetical protein